MIQYEVMDNDKLIALVDTSPKLQEFIYHLYSKKEYDLDKLKSMGNYEKGIAFYILNDIYPCNVFGALEKYNTNN